MEKKTAAMTAAWYCAFPLKLRPLNWLYCRWPKRRPAGIARDILADLQTAFHCFYEERFHWSALPPMDAMARPSVYGGSSNKRRPYVTIRYRDTIIAIKDLKGLIWKSIKGDQYLQTAREIFCLFLWFFFTAAPFQVLKHFYTIVQQGLVIIVTFLNSMDHANKFVSWLYSDCRTDIMINDPIGRGISTKSRRQLYRCVKIDLAPKPKLILLKRFELVNGFWRALIKLFSGIKYNPGCR